MIWRNYYIDGMQHAIFTVNGTKHFRYSFTRELKRFAPERLLGKTHITVQLGTGDKRYHSKRRTFKK